MSIVSVQPKDFILALFIRDDGERFLLGDGGYDFKDSQLHFVGNTIENDEVAKQGTDGTLLAGQVRRSAIQSFDGYIGDATVTKEAIEQMRRDFIAFFMKGHHFRVVYVDCARNAWQRKGGYLVDAPEVKELWQIHPEYHVALNFEDVNYYVYDENADGDEILAIVQSVPISSEVEGGLEWDANGAISDAAQMDNETKTVTGSIISMTDAVVAPFADLEIEGNTSQDGTPTPSAPVPVRTVTGENIVKVSDGQGNEQSYEINLGKNLANMSSSSGGSTMTYTLGGSVAILNGSVASGNVRNTAGVGIYLDSGTYTFSAKKLSGSATNDRTRLIFRIGSDAIATVRTDITEGGMSASFTVGARAQVSLQIYADGATTANNLEIGIQIEKGSQATSYAPYFTPIELCKIGDYQDYIYKSGSKWYKHKVINKVIIDGSSETWGTTGAGVPYISSIADYATSNNTPVSDYFIGQNNQSSGVEVSNNKICFSTNSALSSRRLWFKYPNDFADTAALRTWLATHNATIYYRLAGTYVVEEEITNEALVAQLNNLKEGGTLAGINNIAIVPAVGNETGTLEIQYYTKYSPVPIGGGYVWEEGGEGGPTTVINESIAEVYPVWTVPGPALNPTLENATTGEQIEFVGMVGEGQTLVVDMGAQTALLNGLNVISSMAGEFISLQVGQNTLLYSASGDAGASEIGWSPIVG